MAMLHITKENYQELVEQSAQPVLLEFWAPWCTYCRRIAGVVAKLPEAYAGRAAVAQVNIDEQPELGRYHPLTHPCEKWGGGREVGRAGFQGGYRRLDAGAVRINRKARQAYGKNI